MNEATALAALSKYGSTRAAGKALGVHSTTIQKWAKRGRVNGTQAAPADESQAGTKAMGIVLTPATRMLDKRPPTTPRAKFYTLPKGRAFKVSDLAKEWGFSANTIKTHAKDNGCFAFIDITGHDDWAECVMHPETAANRLKGTEA